VEKLRAILKRGECLHRQSTNTTKTQQLQRAKREKKTYATVVPIKNVDGGDLRNFSDALLLL
jgi:hypothetical protein